jgi:hypothetical protein
MRRPIDIIDNQGPGEMTMENQTKTSPVALGIFWLYVLVPLAWGVFNTLRSASKLFTG